MISVIIVAAGQGKRMGDVGNKVLLPLGDQPVLFYSVQLFCAIPQVGEIIVVTAERDLASVQQLLEGWRLSVPWQVVKGGAERQDSVTAGLSNVAKCADLVAIHDGARPLIDRDTVCRAVAEAERWGAACVGVRVKDTIKTVDDKGFVIATPERSGLWAVQTPQIFVADVLRQAYASLKDGVTGCTDDAMVVERSGRPVKMVEGSYANLKITTPEDLPLAERLLRMREGNT